jgi:hypothetical protein
MALGARHYFIYFDYFSVRQGMLSASVVVTAGVSAWLLCALYCSSHADRSDSVQTSLLASSSSYYSFLDSRFESYFLPETFSEGFALRSGEHQASLASSQLLAPVKPDITTAPWETSRPLQTSALIPRSSPRRVAQYTALGGNTQSDDALASSPDDKMTIFERFFAKLFGKPAPPSVRLAYATADDSQLGNVGRLVTSRYDQWTGVYDISARTVYMPDGTQLEAHSGLGASLDDPANINQKDRGPTPPNVYNLELRGKSFHGVRALRLIPVDDQKMFGRTGLLAHSFMLGPNGESNGCLSLKDYDAFLRAYMDHQIKRLVVVARSD